MLGGVMNKIIVSFAVLAALLAVTILQGCATTALTQCATPTLSPSGGSGPGGDRITVKITTATVGAYLRWTDDGSIPTPSHGTEIQAASGDAITVYGRTLRAIAYKAGLTDSPIAVGKYVAQPSH